MNVLLVVLLTVVIASAIAGDLMMCYIVETRSRPLVGFAGASIGALSMLLGLNVLFFFPFLIDPYFFLVQDLFIAGIIGGATDLPLVLYGQIKARRSFRRIAWEAVAISILTCLFLLLEIRFRMNYEPTTLPI